MPESAVETVDSSPPLSPRPGRFTEQATLVFLAPLIVYMIAAMPFDTSPPGDHLAEQHVAAAQARQASNLTQVATVRAALLVPIAVLMVRGLRLPRFGVSWLAIAVGVVGVVLWVGVDAVGLRQAAAGMFDADSFVGGFLFPKRDATNPGELYGSGSSQYWWFLITRFIGLALIVPLAEELMLRGWLMRFLDNPEFWKVPFGEVSMRAAAIGVGFATLYHPEKLASIVWFSLTTWLMFKTKNFWDCVAAHAVTNFLLGVWVLWSGQWELW